jgi:hypothetical protein
MDDTINVSTPEEIKRYQAILCKFDNMKECCKTEGIFLSKDSKTITFRCSICSKTILYDYRHKCYTY